MVLNRIKDLTATAKTKLQEKAEEQSNHVIALDIGTEYVKALVGRLDGDNIEVIGVGRQRQGLSDMHSGAISDISAVVANCDQALTAAEQQAGVSAKRTIIGIAGELVKGTTSTIRYKRPEPEKEITFEEMEYILGRVQKRAYDKARQQVAWETGNEDVDIKLVNSALVSIHIDSYKVSNPIGFQGKDVAVQIYTAFAPMIHIGALERTANELDLDLIAVAAEPFAVTRAVIGADASSNLSAITIDVGGGTTDIAVVNDGGVEGTRMFGIGGRAFTRTIGAELDVAYEEAEDIKLRLASDELEAQTESRAQTAVARTLKVWLDGVKLGLNEFEDVDHLPNHILLCGGGAGLKQLTKELAHSDWFKEAAFTRRPNVQLIDPKQVAGISDATGAVTDHTFITALGLLRVGTDTLMSGGESDSIRDKLNRILKI